MTLPTPHPALHQYRYKGYRLTFGPHSTPYIMGIVNVTPDSFSDGGQFTDPITACGQVDRLVAQGTDILDVGGESSRPGAAPVSADEEYRRIAPVIRHMAAAYPKIPLSVDTSKPAVAEGALALGAAMINDITGFTDPAMIEVAARYGCPVVVMHMKGTPRTMQRRPVYKDVIGEIIQFFEKRIEALTKAGVTKIILDPGVGFGKTITHNLMILNQLDTFVERFSYPVMIGASRKSFIGAILDAPVEEREEGTISVTVLAAMKGAKIIRVHDVGKNRHAIKITQAILRQRRE